MLNDGDELTLEGREMMRRLERTIAVAVDALARASMRHRPRRQQPSRRPEGAGPRPPAGPLASRPRKALLLIS